MDNKDHKLAGFRLPKGFMYQLIYIGLMPAFFICFNYAYTPFDIQSFYDEVGGKNFNFHLLMLTCIILGCMLITRLIFVLIYKRNRFYLIDYILWCLGEIIFTSLFMALYTCLFYKGEMHYFIAVSHCLKFCSLTLLYPYTLLILLRIINNCYYYLDYRERAEETMVKFYDEHKKLKLTIASNSILFIEAESNYIKINYVDNDKAKEFTLRNSMKSIAENANSYGLIRCHRSYYISPKHIKLLKRDKDGLIVAEMLREGIKSIPVSKQYYNELADSL